MPGLMRGPNKDERREMDNKHPQGGGRPCCFFQSLVKPPRSKRRRYTNSRRASGNCLYMGGRMSQNISDVFMTFFSFSDVLRTSPELIVEKNTGVYLIK